MTALDPVRSVLANFSASSTGVGSEKTLRFVTMRTKPLRTRSEMP